MNEGILSIPPPVIRATFGDIANAVESIEHRAVDWCCLMQEKSFEAYIVLFKGKVQCVQYVFPARSVLQRDVHRVLIG